MRAAATAAQASAKLEEEPLAFTPRLGFDLGYVERHREIRIYGMYGNMDRCLGCMGIYKGIWGCMMFGD